MIRIVIIVSILLVVVFALPTPLLAQQNACWGVSGCADEDWWPVQLAEYTALYGGPAPCSWSPPYGNAPYHDSFWAPAYSGGPLRLILCGECIKAGCGSVPPPPPITPPADSYAETGIGCHAPCTAGEPINLASGNTFIQQTDIRVPGLGGGMALDRVWNSMWPTSQSGANYGLFGPNWCSTFEERVFVGNDGTMKYARADGSFWSFQLTNQPQWQVVAPANGGATLAPGSTYWTLTFNNGEKRLFDNVLGSLLAIVDRNGNTTQLSYGVLGRLVTVTDAASRHLYFTYGNNSFPQQVTAITSDVGISLSYAYDQQGRLTMVVKPDGTTVSFEYNSQSLITAVKDSEGKILEAHTYDSSGRGLTSSRANGVETVTVSYPQ